jgi:hypothetical protein
MPRTLSGRSAVLLLLFVTGCSVVGPRRDTATRNTRTKGTDQVAVGPKATREPALADPSTMIPPPPSMDDLVPAIPPPPAKEQLVANPPIDSGLISAGGIVSPGEPGASATGVRPAATRVRPAAAAEPIAESNLDALRRLAKRSSEKYAALDGFECRLTRREMVGKQSMPQEELQYTFRRDPYSVHIKWVGLEGQGRELIYVGSKPDAKVQILTGKNEGLIVPAGKRFTFAPTDSSVRSKSRHDIRESGMAIAVGWFGRVVAIVEKDPAQAKRMKYLGVVKGRPERPAGLEGVEETLPPDWEPMLPRGGKRVTYFDPDPSSPSFGLPILVTAYNESGREVEYYFFDQLKPIKPTDADFDPDRLWKR